MLKKTKTFLVNISVSLITVILLLGIIGISYDIYFRKYFKNPVPFTTGNLFKAFHTDSLLGYRPDNNTYCAGKKIFVDTLIYKMSYHLDSSGHRVTPDSLTTKKKFAVFLGCSFTFGDGLNDNETIPFLFSKASKTFKGYNFGYSGYGPNHGLIKLQHDSLRRIVKQKSGIGFYIFIHDHIYRTIGSMSSFMMNNGQAPCFELENGNIIHRGLFANAHPNRSWLYRKMGNNSFCRFFKIGYPFSLTNEHFELTGKVLEEMSKEYQRKFQNDNFYVIMYPSISQKDYEIDEHIVEYLKSKKIKYLDYRKLFNPTEKGYYIHHDHHPTALANEVLTKQMVKDLRL